MLTLHPPLHPLILQYLGINAMCSMTKGKNSILKFKVTNWPNKMATKFIGQQTKFKAKFLEVLIIQLKMEKSLFINLVSCSLILFMSWKHTSEITHNLRIENSLISSLIELLVYLRKDWTITQLEVGLVVLKETRR